MMLAMGDYNAKTGKKKNQRQAAGYSLQNKSNSNGYMLVVFAVENKRIHLGTWKVPGTTEANQVDHLLVSRRHFSSVLEVRSCRGSNCNSDLYLVRAKIKEKVVKIQRNQRAEAAEKERMCQKHEARKFYEVVNGIKKEFQPRNKGKCTERGLTARGEISQYEDKSQKNTMLKNISEKQKEKEG
ncbi:hypothetical protein J437_LFUL001056 [Ladona fulva]|uniref:Uncharacterized protein n=1 Tax=Ladona fulva TaxID=123851 RepID=A0A8K0K7X6_LADFU|nr:hypothetical protein J437_LFUL001056 [Ladona fulva]